MVVVDITEVIEHISHRLAVTHFSGHHQAFLIVLLGLVVALSQDSENAQSIE